MKVGKAVYNNQTGNSGCFVAKGAKRTRVVVAHRSIKGGHAYGWWKNQDVKEVCQ